MPKGAHFLRIPASKTACLRVLLETLQRGSYCWCSGCVPAAKAVAFADKLATRYAIDANANRRAYRKRQGLANSTLLLFPHETQPTHLRWWLLATPGAGAVHEQEKLLDGRSPRQRLSWGAQYELTQLQKAARVGGGRHWTWRLQTRAYQEWQASVQEAARATGEAQHDRQRLMACLTALRRLPGYHGIRVQQQALLALAQEEWGRHHRAPFPGSSERLPYLDKRFRCYHTPEPLRLDGLVAWMQRLETLPHAAR
ncbi:hypothetical protein EBB06_10915 [Crenobacter cavernae]|uniref:Uncharacterized protein n=2 Tax=Crenobacter cavernae TaxID=2290923 RepID=A0ABY0FDK1_9NEIS|nr:hypothetical protein EBB06_10915 [Crenobacter cavernae]